MNDLNLKSSLKELRDANIKTEEDILVVKPNYADLGCLKNTMFKDWLFLEPLIQKHYKEHEQIQWEDTEGMQSAYELLIGFIERKMIKVPEYAQELIDLLMAMYKDVQAARVNYPKQLVMAQREYAAFVKNHPEFEEDFSAEHPDFEADPKLVEKHKELKENLTKIEQLNKSIQDESK